MKKDHIRDYATNAFRAYAAQGMPTYEQLRERLIREAVAANGEKLNVKGGIFKPTEAAVMAAEKQLDEAYGLLADMLAVISTLDIIRLRPDGDIIIQCLTGVYFKMPKTPLQPGDISDRVAQLSIMIPADRATIYRKLKLARNIFAAERKLNILKTCD